MMEDSKGDFMEKILLSNIESLRKKERKKKEREEEDKRKDDAYKKKMLVIGVAGLVITLVVAIAGILYAHFFK
jgi:F0F1-type ATP synthase assembly protein I